MKVRLVCTLILTSLALAPSLGCSGSSTPADAGRRDGGRDAGLVLTPPEIAITADPAQGMANQATTFTATITGGTPPYISCRWKFGANAEFGPTVTPSGGTCTGNHTFTDNGDYTVVAEVEDNANRIATKPVTYTVGGTVVGMGVDLQIKPNTFQLVNPPTNNRYRPGAEMRVSFTVRNNLLAAAGASVTRVSIKKAFENTETNLGDVDVAGIPASGEQTVSGTFNLPGNVAVGAYDVILRADATMLVAEENEDNNKSTFFSQFAVELAGDGGM